jgi:hypothetical protein
LTRGDPIACAYVPVPIACFTILIPISISIGSWKRKAFRYLKSTSNAMSSHKKQRPTRGHNKQFSATESANAKTLFI